MSDTAVSETETQSAESGTASTPRNRPNGDSTSEPRRRYIKVDVPEEVFVHVHDMANQSRMRLLPYLRRFLEEAWPYSTPGDRPDSISFSSSRMISESQ